MGSVDELDVGDTGRRGKRYRGWFRDSWLEQLGTAVQLSITENSGKEHDQRVGFEMEMTDIQLNM